MLQIETTNFASDALEDAMRLAQTKSLNSYTFSDCINYLNYAWRDIYDRMAMIDDGYYGVNMQITNKLTKLPPYVRNSLQVYSAQSPVGHDRIVYRSADNMEMTHANTYRISGNELYCEDATYRQVWLYYIPACPQVFFTHHNRDPKIYKTEVEVERVSDYNIYRLVGYYTVDDHEYVIDPVHATKEELQACTTWKLVHKVDSKNVIDLTDNIIKENDDENGKWNVCYISCDFPYIFITYINSITGKHVSGFLTSDFCFNEYNPFDFAGRGSDVEYLKCRYNDKTGMGVVVVDYNDNETIKELGWTPDTRLDYPIPEMYRYLVARLADKFSALNESNVMGVQKELIEARYAFEAFLNKDKSSWQRITNVNPATINDWL